MASTNITNAANAANVAPTRRSTRTTAGVSNRFIQSPQNKITKMSTAKAKKSAPKSSAASKKAPTQSKAATKKTTATAPKKTATKPATTKRAAAGAKRKAAQTGDESDDEAPQQSKRIKITFKSGAGNKRKASESDSDDEDAQGNASKRAKSSTPDSAAKKPAAAPKKGRVAKPRAIKPKVVKPKVVINQAPTQRLDIYMAGEGGAGELGLGVGAGKTSALKPKLNTELPSSSVGVVQVAAGGMHCVALTHDNQVLTWGVNDEGALGRDTAWDGKMVDADGDDSDSGSEGANMNKREATPAAVEFPESAEGAVFTQVVAGDSTSFALTDDGFVYGWGTFRGNEGILGFSHDVQIQRTPILIAGLKRITKLANGANHAVALGSKGEVFAWGAGQQHQLGRRIVQRSKLNGLVPREFGLPKGIVDIAAGDNHSFAVHSSGKVYTWGLNNYGQTGIAEGAGGDEAVILHPQVVAALSEHGSITCIDGGQFHSIAITADGKCLSWGRVDGFQTGLKISSLAGDDVVNDSRDLPKILTKPTVVPDMGHVVSGAAGIDYSVAINSDGQAYSWGFGDGYRTGQGTDDDIEVARLMDGKHIRGKHLVSVSAGGQFHVLAGFEKDV